MVNKDKKIKKCSQFGWGFSNDNELCNSCESREECFDLSAKGKIMKGRGHKPAIPYAKDDEIKRPMKVLLRRPVVRDGQLRIEMTILISMKWFRHHLGSGKYT